MQSRPPAEPKEIILASAVTLFAQRGLRGVTLRDIADHSGFLLGSIYHYFPQKKQIYNAAVLQASRHCGRLIRQAMNVADGAEPRFRSLCEILYRSFMSDDPNFRLIDRAVYDTGDADYPGIIETVFNDVHGDLGALISELVGGASVATDPDWLVSYLCSLFYGAAKLHEQHRRFVHGPEQAELFIAQMVDFALKGLGAAQR